MGTFSPQRTFGNVCRTIFGGSSFGEVGVSSHLVGGDLGWLHRVARKLSLLG